MKNAHQFSRRTFLSTAALAVSAGVFGLTGCASPLGRSKKLAVGCRDLHLSTADAPDSWSAMKALGAEAVEVNVDIDLQCVSLVGPGGCKYNLGSKAGVTRLQQDLSASGCKITSFMMANRLDERLEQEVNCAKKLVEAAEQLDVKAIRIDVVPRTLPAEKFLPFAIESCQKLARVAEGTPVRFGVENHGHWGNNPEVLEKLFQGVGSPHMGLTMDPGNFYWWGHPVDKIYSLYEQFASRAIHLHCKSICYPQEKRNVQRPIGWEYGKYCCPITDGDLDYARIIAILRKANYQGDLCVEDESLGKFPKEQRAEVIKKQILLLKGMV